MANELQDLMDTLIMPAALPVLREACVMPALVATDFSAEAQEQNAIIRVPLPQSFAAADDFNPVTGTTITDLEDPKVDIVLDRWKYKAFQMNDKEMRETITSGVLPSAADAAIKVLANAVDLDLLALYKDIPYFHGIAGTVPDNTSDVASVREILQNNLVPQGSRRLVLDTAAETKFLVALKDFDKSGTTTALREASLGRLFGLDTFADQLVPRHIVGTAAADTLAVNGVFSAGVTSIAIDGASAAGRTLMKGDLLTIAGVPGSYVVVANVVSTGSTTFGFTSVPIYPALAAAPADNALVTVVKPASGTSYACNIAFHRDAFMWAARTLTNEQSENSTISVATDPVTGIPLRLETWREPSKSTRFWRFDILYGVKTLRQQLAARLIGKSAA